MSSLFTTLNTAKLALSAQQAALQTTGNNVSNASTPGYTRERVDLQPTTPFPSVGMNQPDIPGQEGTGVEATSVTRVRDSFVDQQVRQQTTSNGYWAAKSDSLSQMENIMNEPSDSGLSKVMNNFWGAMQDLSNDPTNSGAQSVVVQDGQTVADTFHYLSSSLTQVKNNIGSNIGITAGQVNSLAKQINDLNRQIANVEPSGMTANTLYDQRDQLVDQLSKIADIQVSTSPSGGHPAAGAAGLYTIQIKSTDPTTNATTFTTLVDGKTLTTSQLTANPDTNTISIGGQPVPPVGGKLQGLMDSYNKDLPDMLNRLNTMAQNLNDAVQSKIDQANGTTGTIPALFTMDTTKPAAMGINVNSNLLTDPSSVAAGQLVSADPTDPNNTQKIPVALSIANALNSDTYAFDPTNPNQKMTFQGYYQQAIGQMGVNAQAANRMTTNTQSLLDSATQRRDSTSGVSIDEEMTNLIQYQHAYSAAARMVTTINTLLDTVVNLGK